MTERGNRLTQSTHFLTECRSVSSRRRIRSLPLANYIWENWGCSEWTREYFLQAQISDWRWAKLFSRLQKRHVIAWWFHISGTYCICKLGSENFDVCNPLAHVELRISWVSGRANKIPFWIDWNRLWINMNFEFDIHYRSCFTLI